MIKNMLGLLMEDMTTKWKGVRDLAQSMSTCLDQTNAQLNTLEANFNWRHYSVFPNAGNKEGDGNKDQREKGGDTSAAVGKYTIFM